MENVNSLYKAWKIFCNGSLLYAAIPAALILLFIQARKKERAYLGLVLLLLAAAIYNPFSYRILTDIVGSSNYRIFWLLPGWSDLPPPFWIVQRRNPPLRKHAC